MDFLYSKDRLVAASLASYQTIGLNGKYISGGNILMWLILSFIVMMSFVNFLYTPSSGKLLGPANEDAKEKLGVLYGKL